MRRERQYEGNSVSGENDWPIVSRVLVSALSSAVVATRVKLLVAAEKAHDSALPAHVANGDPAIRIALRAA